ncbi:glycerophosphodiester phosphodiesterase family protein [Balneolales bacterium ANBcel1]|nr:glycerophosphodiester phosphodiesterase family protein [Balneolales bacterium ANBcel1]
MLLSIFMITGCTNRGPELPHCFDLQGHRGAMGLKPENTIASFLKAAELGVNTIEFDLAVTREHKLVVSHEPWFRSDICLRPDGSPIPRQQERSFRLYELSYVEIAEYDCGSIQHPAHPEQKTKPAAKPLMIDAIEAVDRHTRKLGREPVRFNIEIKSDPAWDNTLTPPPEVFARLLHEELLKLKNQLDKNIFRRVNVQSFDPRALKAFRSIAPNVPVAILTYQEGTVDDHIEYFGFLPEIYSPNFGLLTEAHVERTRELGMRVVPWTVNRKEDMTQMIRLGVDGLITDYPGRFNELYGRRVRCDNKRYKSPQQGT